MLHSVRGCTRLSGDAHKKLMESGPRDNRGVILSVSIKCIGEPSKGGGRGATACLVTGQTLSTGEREGGGGGGR